MQPHIRRWHTRYRVIGERGHGVALIERGVRERVVESYAAAIERAFAHDPAVYVLRHVHAELTVASPSASSEAENARRWAAQIFAGVVRTVTREGDRADLVMRFEDGADYVARFLVELLDGAAWGRWYYGAFWKYRGLEDDETVRRIFVDFANELPAIFRRLAALGRLRATLSHLSHEAAGDIWRSAIRRTPKESPEALRIFVRTALALARALELWIRAGPSEDEVLLQYFRTSPRQTDWRQPRDLAEAVYAAFDFLDRTGLLARDAPGVFERFVHAGEPLLESLEWLDHKWLAAALRAHLSPRSEAIETAVSRPLALSPLQLRLLEVLLQLLETGGVTLPDADSESHANALALFAALSSVQPTLAAHSATPALIEWLLARWQASPGSPFEKALPRAQRLGSLITLILEREASRPSPKPRESLLLKVPEQKLEAAPLRSGAVSQENLVESSFAGIFLLSRGVIEGRATQLASAMGLSSAAVLLGLAAEWTGANPDAMDPGVLLWAGYDSEAGAPSAQIRALDPGACESLCAAIERILCDRAAFAPSLAPVREPDATPLAAIARHLLRLWAHWLPGFAQSSATFLLDQVIRRGGLLRVDSREIAVSLRPAALDVVLQMAGYLQPIPAVPWLADRRVTFSINSAV